jgi:MFS transporter, FHS family, glucose/mannose:H+ symporter
LSGGLIQVTTNTVISALNTENRAPALNLLHFSFGLGALSGPLLSGFILQNGINWSFVYYIMAAYSAVVSILYLFIRFPSVNSGKIKGNMSFLKYFKSTYFGLMILAIVIYVGVEMGINSWSVNYTHEKHGLGNFTASSILSYFWIFMTVGRLLCIPLTKRFRPALVMLTLISFSVLAFIGFVFSSHVILSFISISVIGLCFSGIFPILLSLGGNHYKDDIGSVTIVFMAFSCLGIMVFPLMMGIMKDSFSITSGMRMLLAFDAILAVIMVIIYKKSTKKINS